MKIAFITPDYTDKNLPRRPRLIGGSGYYRCQLVADALNKHASDVHAEVFAGAWPHPETGELYPAKHLNPHIPDQLLCDETGWDVLVLQRWMAEKDRKRILRARALGQIVINDVDDHFWAVHRDNLAYKEVQRAEWNAELYRRNLQASDHITTSTPYLAQHLEPLGVPVTVLPNMIDLTQWTRQDIRPEVATVGWCGHTGYRSGDLETLGNAMRYFLRDHKQIRFIHGGHDPTSTPAAKLLNIPVSRTELRPACPITQWPRIWRGIDIAIIPLNTVPFNEAKSAIKSMEAAAAGVPFIATNWGPYADYHSGRLVTTPTQWRDALEEMLDHNTRQHVATRAYTQIQQEDTSIRWKDWHTLYAALCPTTTTA